MIPLSIRKPVLSDSWISCDVEQIVKYIINFYYMHYYYYYYISYVSQFMREKWIGFLCVRRKNKIMQIFALQSSCADRLFEWFQNLKGYYYSTCVYTTYIFDRFVTSVLFTMFVFLYKIVDLKRLERFYQNTRNDACIFCCNYIYVCPNQILTLTLDVT